MQCDELTDDLLADRFDGDLEEEARRAVEEHLAACPACRERAAGVEAVLGAASAWPALRAVPERIDAAVRRSAREAAERARAPATPRPAASWTRWALPIAASFVLMVSAFVAGMTARPLLVEPPSPPAPAAPTADTEPLEDEIGRLRAQLKEVEANQDAVRDDMAAAYVQLDETRRALADREARIEALSTDLEKQREDKRELQFELSTRVNHLHEELAKAELIGEKALDLIGKLKQENARLEEERDNARVRVETLRDENRTLTERARVPGDLNGDGTADVRDAREIAIRLAAGAEPAFVEEADLNADGRIDVADALLIARRAAGAN